MKRFLCLILSVLFLISGCSFASEEKKSTVFYYCRTEFVYADADGVIAPEYREISENASDLSNLLALYLVGPLDEGLTSPFIGTKLLSVSKQDGQLRIKLAQGDRPITDADFTLASACMAMTCMELMELNQVTVTCEDQSATIRQDNLLLYDTITSTENTPEESQ